MAEEDRPSVFKEASIENAFERVDLNRVTAGIKRRLWVPVVCGILFALGCGIISHHFLKKYNAEVLLLYRKENRHLDVPGLKGGYTLNAFSLPTLVDMISLPNHFKAVRSILGLSMDADDISGMITVEVPNRQADIISVQASADNPSLAVDIANTLASVAVKHSQSIRVNQLQVARDYFRQQLEVAQDRLSRHLAEMAEFKKNHASVEMRTDGMGTLRGLEQAEDRLREARLSYESLLVEYENLRREINKIPDHVVKEAHENDPIKDRIAQTELALLHARARYAVDNPKIKVLEEELAQLRDIVTDGAFDDATEKVYIKNQMKEGLNIELVRLQGKLRSAQKLKEESELVLMQMQQELSTLPEEQMSFVRMLHNKSMFEEQLKMAEEAIRSAEMLISLGRGDVEIYQLAETAPQSDSKILKFLPVAGLVLGLGFGLVLALVLEATNRSLCTSKEIGISYSVPCLQVIPELSRLNAKTAEAKTLFFIRSLSDRLTYLSGDKSLSSILVTSGLRGEGKSTVAWNLAKYHKKLGKKVIYLQLDHQGALYTNGSESKGSINQYLSGAASLDDVIHRGDVDWMKVEWAEDLKELLAGETTDKLFHALKNRYDTIVIDGPGVIDDDYAVTLCRRADAVLFVIGSSKVKQPLVDTALLDLEENGIAPTGLILNRVRSGYCTDPRLTEEKKRQRRLWWKSWLKSGNEGDSASA